MNLKLSAEEAAFEAEVTQFVERHWHPDTGRTQGLASELDGQAWTPALKAWFAALVEAGWSVPHWPQHRGGTGWDPTHHFLFQRVLVAAGAPSPVNLATGVLGPLFLNELPSSALQTWIEQIRAFKARWSVAAAEPVAAEPLDGVHPPQPITSAAKTSSGFVINGEKTWVTGGLHADYLLCLSHLDEEGQSAWFVVPTNLRGVTREAIPMMGSRHALARIVLLQVEVDGSARLATNPEAGLPTAPLRLRGPSLRRALLSIRDTAVQFEDAALRTETDMLSVQADAVEALEHRATFGDPIAASALRLVLAIKGAELGQAVSGLRARSMGYHAVPFPDDPRLSNEGVFGDEVALPAVRQALFDRAFSLYAAESPGQGTSIEALKDRMVREILGTNVLDDKLITQRL